MTKWLLSLFAALTLTSNVWARADVRVRTVFGDDNNDVAASVFWDSREQNLKMRVHGVQGDDDINVAASVFYDSRKQLVLSGMGLGTISATTLYAPIAASLTQASFAFPAHTRYVRISLGGEALGSASLYFGISWTTSASGACAAGSANCLTTFIQVTRDNPVTFTELDTAATLYYFAGLGSDLAYGAGTRLNVTYLRP